ncbi:hypothetical protein [Methanospirillum lacunae]|nr:hypothetical protein [Methanospirillum lacunae]
MSGMITISWFYTTSHVLMVGLGMLYLFGSKDTKRKIEHIAWSVPIPPDLLSRLREFSPVSISKVSGIYLDDVFDILKGNKTKTAPEVIDKLNKTIEILIKQDEELEREAAKIGFMIRGFDAIEQREHEKTDQPKRITGKGKT